MDLPLTGVLTHSIGKVDAVQTCHRTLVELEGLDIGLQDTNGVRESFEQISDTIRDFGQYYCVASVHTGSSCETSGFWSGLFV